MSPSRALLAFAAQVLGPVTSENQYTGAVTRVRDASGAEYVVKLHASKDKHARETGAYQHWVPALGQLAPQLVAADPDTGAIVVTALPGEPCTSPGTEDAHRQAGALLQAFHSAAPPRPARNYMQWLTSRASYWLETAEPLLSRQQQVIVRAHLEALAERDFPTAVPCHLDFQPRNWLADHAGTVRLIDFEHARHGPPERDLVRLEFRIWASQPRLRDAFLSGYGRCLTEDEQQTLQHFGALDALTSLARGADTGDADLAAHGHATIRLLGSQP